MKGNNQLELVDIFKKYNVLLTSGEGFRNIIDVLEDLYLKISSAEYEAIIKTIADTESTKGHIFDKARNRPYQ
jgi:hypothetical protein